MKRKLFLAAIGLFITVFTIAAPPAEEGKTIFQGRCASCHNVNKILVGPALAGIDRRHDMEWIIKFVQSSQGLIQSGDKEAIALFATYNNVPMPDHKDLSAESIKTVVDYMKAESTTAEANKPPFPKPSRFKPAYMPISFSNYGFFTVLLGAVLLLVFSLLAFVRVKEYERNKAAMK